MVDSQAPAHSLALAWASLGRRIAAASGALAALVALLQDVNLWMASLRGAATCLAVLVLVRLARAALEWSGREDAGGRDEAPERKEART